jgi:hypothetical protein
MFDIQLVPSGGQLVPQSTPLRVVMTVMPMMMCAFQHVVGEDRSPGPVVTQKESSPRSAEASPPYHFSQYCKYQR